MCTNLLSIGSFLEPAAMPFILALTHLTEPSGFMNIFEDHLQALTPKLTEKGDHILIIGHFPGKTFS